MGTGIIGGGKMGMKVKNGARWKWSCAWGFMHVRNDVNELNVG